MDIKQHAAQKTQYIDAMRCSKAQFQQANAAVNDSPVTRRVHSPSIACLDKELANDTTALPN